MGEGLQTLRTFSRFLFAIVVLCLVSSPPTSSSQGFSTDLEGKPFDPFRAAQGKVVVLIFVRTDCPVSNRYATTIAFFSALEVDKAIFFAVYSKQTEATKNIR